jgi:hypothetical protein
MRFFTKKEDAFLKRNYMKIPCKRMARILGRSEGSARHRLHRLGFVVPPEIAQKFKNQNQFKKGKVPANKGKKQTEFISRAGIKRTVATRFKKGGVPKNLKPLGSTRVSKDGYLEIKTMEPNKWEHYHRLMWEETFGDIPKGKIVRFVTKDKLNVHPFNLELVDRVENMRRNSIHNRGKEIAQVCQLLGVLQRQINKRK